MPFFIVNEPYKRTVTSPDGAEGEVTLRRLNAGDQAAIQDTLRMQLNQDEGADASMALGTMRMLTVQRAVVDWSWPGPKPSPEAISQLEPEVFEQIYAYCEIGTPPTPPTDGQAPQNGETPLGATGQEAATETAGDGKTRRKAAAAS